MDVTCTRCGTVYEFEEGLVSASGTTVKCTQCGHLFKVRKPADEPADSLSAQLESAKWRLRRPDGTVHPLESLAQLSRAIVEGRFDEHDEISGTGQVWRRLGEISELSALFGPQRARPASQRPVAAVVPVSRGEEHGGRELAPLPPPPSSSLRPRKNTPPRDREFQVMGAPVTAEGMPAASASVPPPAPRPPRPRTSTPVAAAPMPSAPPPPPPPATSAAPHPTAPTPSLPPAPSNGAAAIAAPAVAPKPALAAAPAPAPTAVRTRRSPWPLISLLVLLAAGGAAAWLTFERIAPSAQPHPAREFLVRADAALASHRVSRFEEAVSEYTKALAFHEDDAHILSSLSRVYAVWSQLVRTQAAALKTQNASAQEVARLEGEAMRLAESAKHHGERAAQRNPGNSEAEVALADALRLTGNLVAARAELDRASKSTAPNAETLRVAALLAIDEANGDMRAGRELAEQAVGEDPQLLRARLLLIQCLIAESDLSGARRHLDAVRATAPDHPRLGELSRAIEQAAQPSATVAAAGSTASAGTQAVPAPGGQGARAAGGAGGSTSTEREVVEAVDDDSLARELVRRGERALEDGSVRAAQQHFEEALDLAADDPAALTGLGYVALERGQPVVALQRFRPAARSGHAEAWIGLGDAYRRTGNSRAALGAYRTYVKRFPRGPRRSIALHQIELLQEQLAAGTAP